MKITNSQEEYLLSAPNIDRISEEVEHFLGALKTDEKKNLRLRLTVEEILLNWQEFYGEEQKVLLKLGSRLGKSFIVLETWGDECNPVHSDFENEWMSRILADLELKPAYTYQRKKNTVSIYPEKKQKGMFYWLVVAVLLGLLISLCSGQIPDGFKTAMVEQMINPMMDLFFGMISMLAGPLIFLSVFTGICGIGDVSSFSRIGKSVVLRSVMYSLIGTLFTAAASLAFFGIHFEEGSSSLSAAGELFQMILDIFPTNLVDAFLSGNTMQIIVLAVGFGAAALVLGGRVQGIMRSCELLQKMISVVMGWMCNLIPALIFMTILQNVWSGTGKIILSGWEPLLLINILFIVAVVVQTVWVCMRWKINLKEYVKKIAPAAIIGFTTASSSAAFTEISETAGKKLGIDKTFAGFSIPLYLVIMGIVNAIDFYTFMIYAAKNYHVSISVGWFIISIVTMTLLSSATPPISGAGLTIYTVLFAQMGIPSAAIPVILTMEILEDFMATGVKVAMIENEAVLNACKNRFCNMEMLRK